MMSPLSLTLWRFAAASAGSLLFAWLLSALLQRAARRWPALAAHRSVWLLGQAAVALVFLCALAPLPRTGLAPAVALPPALAGAADFAQAAEPATEAAGGADATPARFPAAAHPAAQPAAHPAAPLAPAALRSTTAIALHWLPAAWLACYLGGLAWTAVRRLVAARRWQRALLRHSRVLGAAELAAWPGLTPPQRRRIAALKLSVRTTGLAVSPAMLGLLRPCLVLPGHLRTLDPAQQTMIIEHELTHWRRRDGAWLAASSLAGLLFWFNRPYQGLGAALREAVELGCDDTVLAGRAQRERQTYAAALVAQLRLQHHHGHAAPAFGQLGVKERVLRMRELRPPRLSRAGRLAAAAAALGLATLGAALQPALSSPAALPSTPPPVSHGALAAPAPQAWRYPLAQPRVSSLYGVRSPQRSNAHHGIDFAARRGTPVTAVADGIVAEASADDRLGNYVRVDHGGGRQSLMAHLDSIAVRAGQHVDAGQSIGGAGATGMATGPHLHLEYWQDGHRRNPELVLAGLPAHATSRALAQRKAQGFPIPDDE